MTRSQHILFHLGDAVAATLGLLHSILDPPPDEPVEHAFLSGFRMWGVDEGDHRSVEAGR